jgi:DnaJ-domain-containing protein 1
MSMLPETEPGAAAGLARAGLKFFSSILVPHAWVLAGLILGIFSGWFVLAFGVILGAMLDVARNEARSRRVIATFLGGGAEAPPPEPFAGYAAAACVALRGEWTGLANIEARKALFDRYSREELGRLPRARRQGERIADVAARCPSPDLPVLARHLATSGDERARALLADWAFALAALGGAKLEAASELALRAALGDCGIGAQELLSARLKAFPGERDAWTVLGVSPAASRTEIKRAYRRLSRLFHPDASPGDGGKRFLELQSAYADLTRSPVSEPRRGREGD